jgi:hypothetical protein
MEKWNWPNSPNQFYSNFASGWSINRDLCLVCTKMAGEFAKIGVVRIWIGNGKKGGTQLKYKTENKNCTKIHQYEFGGEKGGVD